MTAEKQLEKYCFSRLQSPLCDSLFAACTLKIGEVEKCISL